MIGIEFFDFEVTFVVKHSIKEVVAVTILAFFWQRKERGVVVCHESIVFQSEVMESSGVGSLKDFVGKVEALAITGRCFTFAPMQGDIEISERFDEIAESFSMGFRIEIPVADALELGIRNTFDKVRGVAESEIASMSHDGCQNGTDTRRVSWVVYLILEMTCEVNFVIDFNKKIRKSNFWDSFSKP